MGYLSDVTGEITIEPPIPARRLSDSSFMLNVPGNEKVDVAFYVSESTEETDEGTLTRRLVTKILSRWTEAYKAYNLQEHLAAAVVRVMAEGSICSGDLVRIGERPGDVERLTVHADGRVAAEKARLVWDDGTEVDL